MVRPVNLSSVIVERKFYSSQVPIGVVHPIKISWRMFGKMSSSAYGNASIKSSGCLHVCLHSKRVSSKLAFALDKQRLAYQLPKIAAALPDRLNPSVVIICR